MSTILKNLLAEMLGQAESQAGTKISRRLARGLQVDIMVQNGKTHLQISRSEGYPSDKEWETVLKSWPYPVMVEPKHLSTPTRKYFQAEWPTQPRLI